MALVAAPVAPASGLIMSNTADAAPVDSAPMTDLDEQGRPEPPLAGDETATLQGFLEYQRATFAWKCAGLDAAGLAATVGVSSMTLGGMLKHLALVEDDWFCWWLHGRDRQPPWDTVDWDVDPDWDWHSAAGPGVGGRAHGGVAAGTPFHRVLPRPARCSRSLRDRPPSNSLVARWKGRRPWPGGRGGGEPAGSGGRTTVPMTPKMAAPAVHSATRRDLPAGCKRAFSHRGYLNRPTH